MRIGVGLGIGFQQAAPYVSPFAQYGTLLADYNPARGVKDIGGGRVSVWAPAGAVEWEAVQATSGKRPLLQATGGENGGPAILFANARDDALKTPSFAVAEPLTILSKCKAATGVTSMSLCDALGADGRRIQWLADLIACVRGGVATRAFSVAAWHNVQLVLDDDNSRLRCDASETTFDSGPTAANGLTIGNYATLGSGLAWDGPIERILVYSGALSSGVVDTIFGEFDAL